MNEKTRCLAVYLIYLFIGTGYMAGQDNPWGTPPTKLSMKEAAERAAAVSPELRGTEAQQVLREGSWALGFRAFLPKLSISASEDDRLSQVGTDSFTKSYTLSIQQLVWDGGRLAASRNIEKAELNLARLALKRKTAEIGESVINLYRTIIYNQALLEIKEANLKSLEMQYSILREEVSRGLALESDLQEAELSLESNRLDTRKLQMDMETAQMELADALGLAKLPSLSDRIDTEYAAAVKPSDLNNLVSFVGQIALQVHPDLISERFAIQKMQVQLQSASRAWWPTFKLSGDVSVLGDRYPLSRYNYSLGLVMEFSSPLISGSLGARAGKEGPYDTTGRLQSSLEPIPDPASSLSKQSLEAMLSLEQEKYQLQLKQIERETQRLLHSCVMAEERRLLARKQVELSRKRYELQEIKHSLGQATMLDVMKAQNELAQVETALVEAAVNLLQTERKLEQFLDLSPGELGTFLQHLQGVQP